MEHRTHRRCHGQIAACLHDEADQRLQKRLIKQRCRGHLLIGEKNHGIGRATDARIHLIAQNAHDREWFLHPCLFAADDDLLLQRIFVRKVLFGQ